MLNEQLSEKVSTSIEVVSKVDIPDFEYYIRLQDFEKLLLAIIFFSLIFSLLIIVL